MQTKLAGAGALALALSLALALYPRSGVQAAAATAPSATKVALAPVTAGVQQRVATGVGELEAVRQVQVAAEAGGRIARIHFDSGQRVAAGALLVQLNDAPEQAALVRLRAQLKNAESSYERVRSLVAGKAATQEQLEAALAARDAAQGELRQTQAMIDQKAIRAPFAGRMGIRRVHPGQYLNPADPVASLVDTSALLVNFALDEHSGASLAPGQKIEVLVDAQPGKMYPATINAIDPLIARSRMVQLQATLAGADGALKAGMYATVRVVRDTGAQQLTVPETAVTYSAYGDTVFLAERGTRPGAAPWSVRRVAVTLGERADGRVEIVRGLRAGQQVVASGQLRLDDGMAVQAVANTLDQEIDKGSRR